jgi:hypothetical protein
MEGNNQGNDAPRFETFADVFSFSLCTTQLAEMITNEMLPSLYADSFDVVFAGTQKFRRLLSREPNPPIDEVIQSGAVARLVQLLAADDQPGLQVSFI